MRKESSPFLSLPSPSPSVSLSSLSPLSLVSLVFLPPSSLSVFNSLPGLFPLSPSVFSLLGLLPFPFLPVFLNNLFSLSPPARFVLCYLGALHLSFLSLPLSLLTLTPLPPSHTHRLYVTMPMIKLQSSDGEIFDVDVEIAKASNTIKTMIEGKTACDGM